MSGEFIGDYQLTHWRTAVGGAFAFGLGETFVLSNQPGDEVLELVVSEVEPRLSRTANEAQNALITYEARLALPSGQVVARSARVITSPISTSVADHDLIFQSALEEMVREAAPVLVAGIPADFPSSARRSQTWRDSLPQPVADGAVPTLPAPSHCVASELPAWRGATAAQKKALLDQCR